MSRAKLTPELIQSMAAAISEGNYVETVIRAHGIGRSSYYEWRRRGATATSGLHRQLYEATEAAQAKAEQHYVGVIKDAANSGTWTAAAWYLERRYPDRWGRRDRMDVTSGGQSIAPLNLRDLSDEELATIEKIVGRAGGKSALPAGDTGGESEA